MTRRFQMDRRAYLQTVGAAGATAVVAGCLGDIGGGEDVIVPGTASGFPPFEFTEDGELVGFDIDLAEEAIDRAGYEVGDWTDIEFDSLIPSLTEDDIDLIAAAMTITDERAETIAFSDPYYESDQAVLVHADGDLDPNDVEDLEGAFVGAQSGTTGEGEVEALIEDGIVDGDDFRQYDNYTLAVQDLENQNVDAIVVDIPVAENFEEGRDVEIAFVIETGEEFGLGMRQDDDRIGDINDALAEIQDDGTYEELVENWFE
ncbi:basic amino acid ABC transporter substrate-binding protein [Natrialbaceae archaeon A-CW1-1]